MTNLITIAGTGHRPDKLRVPDPYSDRTLKRLTKCAEAYLQILEAEYGQVDEFISGMALGWDFAGGLASLNLGIPLVAAVPFKGQECRWTKEDQELYRWILERCAEVHYVCEPGYAAWKMQKRNEFMTDRASVMLALWNGSTGGTGNCVKYAKSKGVRIVNCWNSWMKYGVNAA